MKKITLFLFSFFLIIVSLSARHIIGGGITYECLGGGDYEFTMKMYRDCNCTGCADFDSPTSANGPAVIGIYRCGPGGTPCPSIDKSNLITSFGLEAPTVVPVSAPDYPCLIPPNVCVQEGTYTWRLSDFGVSLPVSNESYYFVYQRCCRNVTINNLNNPGDQGSTFMIELTPTSQSECNDSPIFSSFPPTVVCANQPLVFDHSATDPDGDEIRYEFCAPLQGGGNRLTPDVFESCQGAKPTPPCPPPFTNVNFITSTYSASEPMAGDPIVSIDPNTGIITGTPTLQGQFVVGVCATEYRNGIAIGRIIRDFQFNVASCDPTVVSRMEADEIVGNDYFFKLCGDDQLNIQNTSFQQRFIDDFYWTVDLKTRTDTIRDWHPAISFPDTGQYTGHLYLNPGTDCGDTANIFISVSPSPVADFEFSYDTCNAGPVQFSGTASVLGGTIAEYRWMFGDGETSSEEDPSHVYRIPGNLPVNFQVTDTKGCITSVTKTINYFPVPNLIVIAPSAESGCQPLEVFFDNLSFPIDDTYDINWDFGDGGTSTEISPTHIFETTGLFTVSVDITSPIGCTTDTVFNSLVLVKESPIARFDYNPKEVTSFNKTVDFENQSERERFVQWTFDDIFRTPEPNPSYTFRDTGIHFVRLIAIHESGCRDTAELRLDVIPKVTYYLPNAFTPNNDSQNDTYKGVGHTEGMTDFRMTIWNRWGEMIFETNDPTEGWNGQKNNIGKPSPNGVYIVAVKYTDPRSKRVELQGIATVVR